MPSILSPAFLLAMAMAALVPRMCASQASYGSIHCYDVNNPKRTLYHWEFRSQIMEFFSIGRDEKTGTYHPNMHCDMVWSNAPGCYPAVLFLNCGLHDPTTCHDRADVTVQQGRAVAQRRYCSNTGDTGDVDTHMQNLVSTIITDDSGELVGCAGMILAVCPSVIGRRRRDTQPKSWKTAKSTEDLFDVLLDRTARDEVQRAVKKADSPAWDVVGAELRRERRAVLESCACGFDEADKCPEILEPLKILVGKNITAEERLDQLCSIMAEDTCFQHYFNSIPKAAPVNCDYCTSSRATQQDLTKQITKTVKKMLVGNALVKPLNPPGLAGRSRRASVSSAATLSSLITGYESVRRSYKTYCSSYVY